MVDIDKIKKVNPIMKHGIIGSTVENINNEFVYVKKEKGLVTIQIGSCHAEFTNEELDNFIMALKEVKRK